MTDYLPRIIGNAFIARDGRARKLSLIEQFYIRLGWLTANKLQKRIDTDGVRANSETSSETRNKGAK